LRPPVMESMEMRGSRAARTTLASAAVAGLLLVSGSGCTGNVSGSPESRETTHNGGARQELSTEKETGSAPEEGEMREYSGRDRDTGRGSGGEPATGSADDLLVVVDGEHGLPEDYAPDDLEPLHPLGIKTLGGGGMLLRREAAQATSRMVADAAERGIELVVCSAYRSYEAQAVSRGRMAAVYGERAGDFVASPGYSEHQLGTAIDLSNAEVGYQLVQRFGDTEAYRWLEENAVDYGFVLSYPEEAEEVTGYKWEPWHYRYVGQQNARVYAGGDYESPQRFFLEEGVVSKSPPGDR